METTLMECHNEKETSSLEINKIHFGDSIQKMKLIPDKSIDMVLCDLPYAVTKNKWDSIIPLPLLWEQYDRITKNNAAIVLFGQGMFTAKMMLFREDIHRYNLIWEKDRTSGFLNANEMPLRNHEDIMVFYKEQPTYNPQKWQGKPQHSRGKNFKNQKNNNYGDFVQWDKGTGNTDKMPPSVIYCKRPHPPIHPTQKPIDLYRFLINTFTNEGDLVLDNTSGSGTIAGACIEEDRNFIAIENDFDIYNDSVNRYEPLIKNKQSKIRF